MKMQEAHAHTRRQLGPAREPVLKEEDQGQHDQGRGEHRHVDEAVLPDPLPEFRGRLGLCQRLDRRRWAQEPGSGFR